jgi:oligo-1,6-glucosidase
MRIRPRVHEYVREMNREALSSKPDFDPFCYIVDSTKLAEHDIFTVGEAPFSRSANDLAEYVLPGNNELQMVFQFEVRGARRGTHSENLADLTSAYHD